MKQFLRKLTIISFLSVIALTSTAFAQNVNQTTVQPAEIFPADIDMVYQFNSAAPNPLTQYLNSDENLSEIFNKHAVDENGDVIDVKNNEELSALMKKIINNNVFNFAMKVDVSANANDELENSSLYVTAQISQENFDKLVSLTKAQSTTENKITIYSADEKTFFTKVGNLLVASNSKEKLATLIDSYNKKNVANLVTSASYQSSTAFDLPGSFFNVYVNPKVGMKQSELYQNTMSSMGFDFLNQSALNKMLEAIVSEKISVAQVTNGFSFKFGVKGNKDKLITLNSLFDKYNFTPQLYKNISGKDLIFYSEQTNLNGMYKDFMTRVNQNSDALKHFNQWKNEFKTLYKVDFDQDLMAVLSGQNLIAIHNSNQIVPSITAIFDVKNNDSQAKKLLVNLDTLIKQEVGKIQKDEGINFFKSSEVILGNVSYYQYEFDLAALEKGGSMNSVLTPALANIKLRMGITADGLLVISTHPDINKVLGGNITENAKFKTAFQNPEEVVNHVMYFDFENLHNYANTTINLFGYFATNDTTFKTSVDKFFAPWHSFYAKTYATADTSWGMGMLNVDVNGFGDYAEAFKQLLHMPSSDYEDYEPTTEEENVDSEPTTDEQDTASINFCDVKKNDWFFGAVMSLSDNKIVKGYNDGCFRPNQTVTRAEFITMVENLLDQQYPERENKTCELNFSDAKSSDNMWYSANLSKAYCDGLIKGYNADNTLKPNQTITRAEAVEILGRAFDLTSEGAEDITFSDVKTTDWFYNSVNQAHGYGVVTGKSKLEFAPNANLTRAEAAQMIDNI